MNKVLPWVLVGALVVILLAKHIFPKEDPVQVPDYIERIQQQNDSLAKENRIARSRDSIREIKVDSLLGIIQKIDAKIKNNQQHYEIIIHDYDSATTGEFEKFFSDRYGAGQ